MNLQPQHVVRHWVIKCQVWNSVDDRTPALGVAVVVCNFALKKKTLRHSRVVKTRFSLLCHMKEGMFRGNREVRRTRRLWDRGSSNVRCCPEMHFSRLFASMKSGSCCVGSPVGTCSQGLYDISFDPCVAENEVFALDPL